MSRWDIIKGKTIPEANEILKPLGYIAVDEREELNYQNYLKVELEDSKIIKITGIGSWKASENKNKKTR